MIKTINQDLFETLAASQKLFASLDVKEVAATASELASKLLEAESIVIGLKEAGDQLKGFRVSAGGEPEKFAVNGKRVAQLRVPYEAVMVSDGALKDLADQLHVVLGQVREGLLCPLEVEEHPFGFILILHAPSATPWTERDAERAIVMCGPLAQAIENARFHRQLAKFSDESLAVAYEKLKVAHAELQRVQTQMMSTEKLNVVGKLASSVAHQLRNPLGVIKASAQLLLAKLKPDGLLRERLDAIHRNAVHADTIITELLQVARPQPTGPLEPIPVQGVLDEAVKMVESKLLDCGVALNKQYGVLPSVMGSAHHLQQVFMNFIMNALEAMPNKGSLTITGRVEGNRIILVFQDTGEGFTPEALEKVAQPFFTTKAHGVGLGMYTAQQILEAHGGTMDVKSTLGQGTTITVTLPVAASK